MDKPVVHSLDVKREAPVTLDADGDPFNDAMRDGTVKRIETI